MDFLKIIFDQAAFFIVCHLGKTPFLNLSYVVAFFFQINSLFFSWG